jgi:hypothetical protein
MSLRFICQRKKGSPGGGGKSRGLQSHPRPTTSQHKRSYSSQQSVTLPLEGGGDNNGNICSIVGKHCSSIIGTEGPIVAYFKLLYATPVRTDTPFQATPPAF